MEVAIRPSQVQKHFLTSSISIFLYFSLSVIKRYVTEIPAFERLHGMICFFRLIASSGIILGLCEICEVGFGKKLRLMIECVIGAVGAIFLTGHPHGSFHTVSYFYPNPDGTPGLYLNIGKEGRLYCVAFITEVVLVLIIEAYLMKKLLKMRGKRVRYLRTLILLLIFPILPWVFKRLFGISGAYTDPLTFIADNVIMMVLIIRYSIDMPAPVIKEQAVENSRDGIVITDRNRHFRYANKASRQLFPALNDENDNTVTAYLAEHLRDSTVEKDGRKYEIRTDSEPDENDRIHGYLTIIHDISEQEKRTRAGDLKTAAERERVATEMAPAAGIQQSALPHVFPAFPDRPEFDLYASMTPAKEVGGDFYDFFMIDSDNPAIVIADVSDKGIPAALFMMVSRSLIKTQLLSNADPATALRRLNMLLCEGNEAMMFVTVWPAVLEISTGKGIAVNAGHENPGIRRAGGEFELLKYRHDPAVGIMSGIGYRNREFVLHPGDSLFVYTDGVTEARNTTSELFGEVRLTAALNQSLPAGPEDVIRRMHADPDRFAEGAAQADDITMLCPEYKGIAER